MKIFKFSFIFIFFLSGCAAGYEREVKRYEDYFPSRQPAASNDTGSEEYETFSGEDIDYSADNKNGKDDNNEDYYMYQPDEQPAFDTQNISAEGRAYSDDGYFETAPVELDTSETRSTGKCRAVSAPGPKKIGKPYKINGVTYYPMESADGYSEEGIASWYGPGFHGKLTANGERYNQKAMTAAHKTLPLPTLVKVDNLENGKSVIVRVNDRGPYSKGRIIDLTEVAARRLGMIDKGTARVRVSVLSEDPDCYISHGERVNIDRGDFAVQIGAFSVADNAERLAAKYGGKAVISKGYVNGAQWNRVWITGYATKDEAANAISSELGRIYPDAFVVRYK